MSRTMDDSGQPQQAQDTERQSTQDSEQTVSLNTAQAGQQRAR